MHCRNNWLVKVFFASYYSILMLCTSTAFSQERLALDEVIKSTLSKHPAVTEAYFALAEKSAKQEAAQGEFDAKWKTEAKTYGAGYYDGRYIDSYVSKPLETMGLELYSGYRISEDDFPIYDGDLVTAEEGEARVGVRLPLLRGRAIDERRGDLGKTLLDIEGVKLKQKVIRLKLIRDATIAFWSWVAAGKQVKVFENLVNVAKKRNQQLQGQVSAGDKPGFDLVDNQRSVLKRQNELIKMQNYLRNASVKLSLYFRDKKGRPIVPSLHELPVEIPKPKKGDFQNVSEKTLIAEALKSRPEMLIVEVQKKQVDVDVQTAENQFLPQLDVDLAAAQDFGTAKKNIDQGELKLGLKIEVPLQYRKPRGKLNAAKSQSEQLSANLTLLKNTISAEVQQSKNSLQAAKDRVELARQELEAAKELEGGELIKFAQGDSNLIFVNLREQTAAEAAVQEIQALLEYQVESARLQALLARDNF
jgi:outer membrane protein, heavy metal efflux system